MILGRVIGEVWAARRHPGIDGRKLLLVRPHLWYEPPHRSGHLVAVDTLGAGVGEDVLVCLGDAARRALHPGATAGGPAPNLPVEATVMAIVDDVTLSANALSAFRRPLRLPPGAQFADGTPGPGPRGLP